MPEKKENTADNSKLGLTGEPASKTQTASQNNLTGISPKSLAVLIHDIIAHQIELKTQNDELRRIQLELENTRNRYADLYDFSPVGYFTLTEKGIIDEANLTIASMFGVERSTLIGMPVSSFISREDQDIFYKHQRSLLERESSRSCELRILKRDGNEFYASFECMVVKETSGDLKKIKVAVIDINERKQTETERKELESQLRQAVKMQALVTLAGGIAHEFNNVLGIILGNTELAMDDIPKWSPARIKLEDVRTAGLRARDIVRQLLSFVRKTEPERKPIKINPTVVGGLELMRSSIPSGIEIRKNIQKESETILADPSQINMVIVNLITNAVHAMEKNCGVLQLSLNHVVLDETMARRHGLSPGPYVKLVVSDTGHGIDPKIKDRIFDPYFTTKGIGKGSGMGLAVVHGIVKSHDGAISVDSEFEKGTAFNIYFPVVDDEFFPKTATDEDIKTGKESILFVDDEKSLVNLMSQMLKRLGYRVEATTTPSDALEIFNANPDKFDLVITDLTMPGMTGDRLAKEILAIRPKMPIILCSGFSDKIEGVKAKESGIRAFIMKPVVIREMADTIRTVLDQG